MVRSELEEAKETLKTRGNGAANGAAHNGNAANGAAHNGNGTAEPAKKWSRKRKTATPTGNAEHQK